MSTPQSLKRRLQSNEDVPSAEITSTASPSTFTTFTCSFAPTPFHEQLTHRLNPSPPFPIQLLRPATLIEFFLRRAAFENYFQSKQTLELQPVGRPFVRSAAPNISIHAYLERLFKYCQPEPVILLSIVAYTERLTALRGLFVPANGWHRWIIAAWLVASKVMNGDQFWTNAFWARVAGITVSELMALEVEFVKIFDWKLHVTIEDLSHSYQLINACVL